MNKIQRVIAINEKIDEFLSAMIHLLCARCWRDNYTNGVSNHTHNSGNIRKMFLGKPDIPINLFIKWVNDIEHGLFHGLSVCFMIFLHRPELFTSVHKIVENYEKDPIEEEILIGSALLHDFYRAIYDIDKDHDRLLETIFPYLRKSTYSHANPPNIFDNLVVGDRLELHRFPDHKDWLIKNKDFSNYLEAGNWELLEIYFSIVRPALVEIYLNRNDRWIRHGIDIPTKSLRHSKVYPAEYQIRDVRQEDPDIYWSVETFKSPFDGCMTHGAVEDKSGKRNDYGRLYGLLPLMKYKKLTSNHLSLCGITPDSKNNHFGKDHFCSGSKILIKDWVYLYHDFNGFTEELNDSFSYLITNSTKIVSHKVAKNWLLVSEKIIDILMGLRVV